ncbi:MAG: hypothetical protein JSW03_09090 [Candidatus Eiseniibacteriota bacterium]|nr:MAG: hypothetical protein JSW03_09090 [Candidatus Eisenbacteria bacterium]
MRHRLAFPAFFSAIILLLLLAGCWNPFKPPKEPNGNGGNGGGEILERTSPENVLNNLRVIYSEKDAVVNTADDAHYWAEKYRELFDPEFKFYFIPKDAPPDLPEPWWGRDGDPGEVVSFEALLNQIASGEIQGIELSWHVNPAVPDNRVEHPDWMWIHVGSVLLDVMKADGDILRVSNGEADFYFGADPADSTLWVVTEWWDRQP